MKYTKFNCKEEKTETVGANFLQKKKENFKFSLKFIGNLASTQNTV